MKNSTHYICYKYKDGRYLKSEYMGDGDYSLILTKELTPESSFKDWPLSEILANCDGVYDDFDNYIEETLNEVDFTAHKIELKIDETNDNN